MKIIQAPHEVLSNKAKRVGKIDKTLLDLIEEMKYTVIHATDPEGVGLAAPQIGKSLQLFIIKEIKETPYFVFINPEVTLLEDIIIEVTPHGPKKNNEEDHRLEGCLSLKDIWGTVKRAQKVRVVYTDETGIKHNEIYDGFFATIIQHEYDHLQGILFPKRTLEQNGNLYKSHKKADGKEVFDPIDL